MWEHTFRGEPWERTFRGEGWIGVGERISRCGWPRCVITHFAGEGGEAPLVSSTTALDPVPWALGLVPGPGAYAL